MIAADFKGGPLRFPKCTAALAVGNHAGTAPSLMTSLIAKLRAGQFESTSQMFSSS